MAELFTNLAKSSLAAGIADSDLSLTVQSGDGNLLFPATTSPDFFRARLFKKSTGDIEIINVTERSGDVFTITRAQEDIGNVSATAFAFAAGDLVELIPTAGFYEDVAAGATSTNIQQGVFLYAADTGAADAYTVAMTPTATALATGQEIRVKIGAGNTNTGGASTLAVDGIAAKPIITITDENPSAGIIEAGETYRFFYDGTSFILRPNNPTLVILDTPELLVSTTTPPIGATALTTIPLRSPTAMICKAVLASGDTGGSHTRFFAGNVGGAPLADDKYLRAIVRATSGGDIHYSATEFTTKLTASNELYYYVQYAGTISVFNIYLVGYYA